MSKPVAPKVQGSCGRICCKRVYYARIFGPTRLHLVKVHTDYTANIQQRHPRCFKAGLSFAFGYFSRYALASGDGTLYARARYSRSSS